MNIKFEIKGKTDVKNLYVRMYQGKFDVSAPIGLLVLESDWDVENNSFYLANPLNLKIQELKLSILRAYNQSFSQGEIITSIWLKNIVKEEFNRPTNEIDLVNDSKDIYLTDFGDWWNQNKADLWKVGPKKLLSKVQKSQYRKIISQLKDFEKSVGYKLVLKDMTLDNMYEIVNYFEENNYNSSTISRNIDRVRFFLNRASEEGLKVSNVRSQRVYIDKGEETDGVFLDQFEIEKILNKDFSFDSDLETTKDNFTIAIFSGMRSSDFLTNLDISNFREGYIRITTQKTKSKVVIPVHKQVERVIKKYHGMLPPKQTNADFNKHIKTLCQLCDIDEPMQGKVFDTKKQRKVFGTYPKYKMVTAHSLRRSFCSNFRGKISDDSLCKIMGWSTDKLISLYDKNSKLSHAVELEKIWNK